MYFFFLESRIAGFDLYTVGLDFIGAVSEGIVVVGGDLPVIIVLFIGIFRLYDLLKQPAKRIIVKIGCNRQVITADRVIFYLLSADYLACLIVDNLSQIAARVVYIGSTSPLPITPHTS